MAIATLQSHVLMAILAQHDLPNLWLGMGRITPWQDESVPPIEDINTTNIDEIIGYKKFDRALLVAPVDPAATDVPSSGTIVYKGNQWQVVSEQDAYTKGARYLYLDVQLEPGDLPYAVYRQVGIYKGLTPSEGYANNSSLIPAQVISNGLLLGYDNRLSQRYADNVSILEQIVIKF